MRLEDIGFYTLSDHRAKQISGDSPLWRCELLITDRCNFRCPYCRGTSEHGDITIESALDIISIWGREGLKNIRFSGGEPTLHPNLIRMVHQAKLFGIERVAISTNGSASYGLYMSLCHAGVDDLSVSLDACCSEDMDKMTGARDYYEVVLQNIMHLTVVMKKYVTLGVVLTKDNVGQILKIVELAENLSVSDVRIIPSAQDDIFLNEAKEIKDYILQKYPILKYRVNNIRNGVHVRGLHESDKRCYLVMDDMAVMGDRHYPCIIYLREGGKPIGSIYNKFFREDRVEWSRKHNVYEDKICRKNCLDVCRDFNRKCSEHGKNSRKE